MEGRGVPAVAFCTDSFAPLASIEARGMGFGGLPLMVVPHPNATRTPEELDRLAAQVLDDVVEGLTRPARELEDKYSNRKHALPKKAVGEVK